MSMSLGERLTYLGGVAVSKFTEKELGLKPTGPSPVVSRAKSLMTVRPRPLTWGRPGLSSSFPPFPVGHQIAAAVCDTQA